MSASTLLGGKAVRLQVSSGTEVMSVAVTRASKRTACLAIEPGSEFATMPTPLVQSMVGERQSTASGLASPEKSWLARPSTPMQAALWLAQLNQPGVGSPGNCSYSGISTIANAHPRATACAAPPATKGFQKLSGRHVGET
eukprot:scaffold48229_cov70-Phaeocystis_antarctica.AAC.3